MKMRWGECGWARERDSRWRAHLMTNAAPHTYYTDRWAHMGAP